MDKTEKLALALMLSIAEQLLKELNGWASVRNAASDLKQALWEARNEA